MSGDVIDAIDGAIFDWETSPDAMRWAPEPPTVPTPPAVVAFHERFPEVDLEPFMRAMNEAARAMARFAQENFAAIEAAVEAVEAARAKASRDRPAYVSPYGPPPTRRARRT